MQIAMNVPYVEQRHKRVIKFVSRRLLGKLRIAGAAMAVGGAVYLLVGNSWFMPTLLLVLGLVYAFAAEPFLVRQSMRVKNDITRQDYELIVDETGFTIKAATFEQRMAWSTIQRVEEEPDAWFLIINKVQALAVFKELMSEEQRMWFVAILSQRRPA